MIHGIGADIQNAAAFASLGKNDVFFQKVFTEKERKIGEMQKDALPFYAKNFAAKEAVVKAFGEDTNHMRLNEIEVLRKENGAPYAKLLGNMKSLGEKHGIKGIHISVSFDGGTAFACAVLEKHFSPD